MGKGAQVEGDVMSRRFRLIALLAAFLPALMWLASQAQAASGPDLTLHASPLANDQFARGQQGDAGFQISSEHASISADAVITFQLPSDTTLVAVHQAGSNTALNCPSTGTTGQYSCDVGTVAAGDCCGPAIDISFTIAADAPFGAQQVTASVSSPAGPDPNTADDDATSTFTVIGTSILKPSSFTGPVIPAGGAASFVLTVTNTGPDAATNAKVEISLTSAHWSYAHPTFTFGSFGSQPVAPGGNAMEWSIPGTLQPGQHAALSVIIRSTGVDQSGTMLAYAFSDSSGCIPSTCSVSFPIHATVLMKTKTPTPGTPTQSLTGNLANTGASVAVLLPIGLVSLAMGCALLLARSRSGTRIRG